jgi:membrane-associated phospholipid phosphatase
LLDDSGSKSESIDLIPISRKQWLAFGLAFVILWSVALYLWHQANADMSAIMSLNYKNFDAGLETVARAFSRYGMSAIAFIYLCYLLLSFRYDSLAKGRQIFLLIIFSFAVAGITGDLLKEMLDRSRPVLEYAGGLREVKDSGSPAFPSGHATKSVALVLPFLFFALYKGGIHSLVRVILSAIALLVCLSRIILGRHYPSDVLSGIGWAFICLPVAVLIANRILRRMTHALLESASKKWVFVYIGLVILLFMI